LEALNKTFLFAEMGAKASDHGLLEPYGLKLVRKEVSEFFNRPIIREKI